MARLLLLVACLSIALFAVGPATVDARPMPDVCDTVWWAPGCWDPGSGCPPPPMYCQPP